MWIWRALQPQQRSCHTLCRTLVPKTRKIRKRHLPFNQVVGGSNPPSLISELHTKTRFSARNRNRFYTEYRVFFIFSVFYRVFRNMPNPAKTDLLVSHPVSHPFGKFSLQDIPQAAFQKKNPARINLTGPKKKGERGGYSIVISGSRSAIFDQLTTDLKLPLSQSRHCNFCEYSCVIAQCGRIHNPLLYSD